MAELSENQVTNNESTHRFEIEVNGELAVSQYHRRGSTIVFTHTDVPPPLEGHGVGSLLARAALDYARNEKLRVIPRCPFIAAFIEQHPEYQDLVDVEAESE